MKNIVIILLNLTFLGIINLLSQTDGSKQIEKYKLYLTEKADKIYNNEINLKNIDRDEIRKIKKEILQAYQEDPIEILKLKKNSSLEIKEKCGNDAELYRSLSQKKLGVIEEMLMKALIKNIPLEEYNLIKTQMIIRAQVLKVEKKTEVFEEEMKKYKLNIVYLTLLIKDIIKGNKHTNIGKEIVVFYNTDWLTKGVYWENNKEYLFELEFRPRGVNSIKYEIGLITYHSENNGYFPIVNDTVYDEASYYNYGEKVNYRILKDNLVGILSSLN